MGQSTNSPFKGGQVLVAGLVAVIIVLGFVVVIQAVGQSDTAETVDDDGDIDVIANLDNECIDCHANANPGIVEQYGHSAHAGAEILCEDCHEVEAGYPGSVEHQGTHVLPASSSAMCENCHAQEVAQFNQSRHALPAYVAVFGSEDLSDDLQAMYAAIPEGGFIPDKFRERNTIALMEGHAVQNFACEGCHNIGAPNPDGSVGQCQDCHIRHEFSLEQARKPETCNACHIGPDHPQWEIYTESGHGILYQTDGDNWNWDAEPGTLSVEDMPAPTCATCHMSGFGGAATTHDVGSRLTWYLAAPISERRPAWQDNMVEMQSVCLECHNLEFVETFYEEGDELVERINEMVIYSDEIMAQLQEHDLVSPEPFDEPIDYVYFNLWHHYGRTAKSGAWMQGPDYVQWHGAYEILHELAHLREEAIERLEAEGLEYEEVVPMFQSDYFDQFREDDEE
ncbi:MAG: nitrate reductase [Chloroflexi bacterium]|nr:nitrate reductase [Chloroflexota bacterium]